MAADEVDGLIEMDRDVALLVVNRGDVFVVRQNSSGVPQLVALGAAEDCSNPQFCHKRGSTLQSGWVFGCLDVADVERPASWVLGPDDTLDVLGKLLREIAVQLRLGDRQRCKSAPHLSPATK
jgi:hypothetical protein